jgi:hypothetical protein
MARRLLIIRWGGFDWEIVENLVVRGYMPTVSIG